MRVLKAGYEIINKDSINGVEILKTVERVGRTCYKSEDNITEDSAVKFVRNLINRGHEAMIEFANITVKFTCDRGCCYDDKTKVLTNNGWKLFSELTENDLYYSIDNYNNICLVKSNKLIKKYYNGELDCWESSRVNLHVTPNHNMWLYDYNKRSPKTRTWKFIKSEEANNRQYKFLKSANPIDRVSNEIITLPSVTINRGFYKEELPKIVLNSKLFLELLGWWVTDGSISKGSNGSGNRVVITQIKQSGRDRIKYLLDNMSLKYKEYDTEFRIKCPQLYNWLSINFEKDKTHNARIPEFIFNYCSKEEMESFLKGVIGGDGSKVTKGTGHQIYTASKKFAEDLTRLCLLIGKSSSIRTVPPRDRLFSNGKLSHCKEQYVVTTSDSIDTLFDSSRRGKRYKENYNGFVYCVELEKYHKLFVMRDGKTCWCGNSHEIVRHRVSSFAQESTRYVNYSSDKNDNQVKFIDIKEGIALDTKMQNMDADTISSIVDEWSKACEDSEKHYLRMIELGATPQIARSVLNSSTKTEINMSANLREWRHFFKLRADKPAHPQMREITIPLLLELNELIPVVFEDIVEDFTNKGIIVK